MPHYNYTTKALGNEAKAAGVALPISFKQSYEVANFIRGKKVQAAKRLLEDVIALRRPVPMKRYNRDTGHKRGMAAGRFTVNTCEHILKLLKGAEANAQFKGLSTSNLVVRHIATHRGPTSWRFGRQRRRQAKRAHVEIIVSEVKEEKKERTVKKAPEKKSPAAKEEPPKQEAKAQEQKAPVQKTEEKKQSEGQTSKTVNEAASK